MERVLLFEITDDGRDYRIYSDGYLEGFREPSRIINRASYAIAAIVSHRINALNQSSEITKDAKTIGPQLADILHEYECRTGSSVP